MLYFSLQLYQDPVSALPSRCGYGYIRNMLFQLDFPSFCWPSTTSCRPHPKCFILKRPGSLPRPA